METKRRTRNEEFQKLQRLMRDFSLMLLEEILKSPNISLSQLKKSVGNKIGIELSRVSYWYALRDLEKFGLILKIKSTEVYFRIDADISESLKNFLNCRQIFMENCAKVKLKKVIAERQDFQNAIMNRKM